jgi:hypothetical protein
LFAESILPAHHPLRCWIKPQERAGRGGGYDLAPGRSPRSTGRHPRPPEGGVVDERATPSGSQSLLPRRDHILRGCPRSTSPTRSTPLNSNGGRERLSRGRLQRLLGRWASRDPSCPHWHKDALSLGLGAYAQMTFRLAPPYAGAADRFWEAAAHPGLSRRNRAQPDIFRESARGERGDETRVRHTARWPDSRRS